MADAQPTPERVSPQIHWEHFDHQADIGVRGYGATVEEAFEAAAVALSAVITDPERVEARQRVPIECRCPDRELLLVDWLNAIIYQMATRNMLFRSFNVRIEDDDLRGEGVGEPVDRERHEPAVEVKGATYTALAVYQEGPGGLWIAQCVVDV